MTMTPERFRAIHGIFKGQWNASGSPGTGSRLFCKLCQADVDSKHHKDCMVGAIHELLAHIDTLTAELAEARREAVEECAAVCRCLLPDSKRGDEIAMHTTDVLNAAMIGIRALLDKPEAGDGEGVMGG